jgi:CRISPR/Cas system-associated endonuclease Cas3-HD
MENLNYNEMYSDLQKLEEYKVLTTFQKLLITELKMINISLDQISTIMNDNSDLSNEDGLNSMCSKIYGSIDDLSSDISDNFDELKETIKG